MDSSEHLQLGAAAAAALYLSTGDAAASGAAFAASWLLDLDHLVDYWRETGFNTDWRRFLHWFEGREPKRQMLPLHGWEWPGLALAAWAGGLAPAWTLGLAAGWFLHLWLDQLYNRLQAPAYWFLWRLKHGFRSEAIWTDAHP